jgi:hypothetical protein
MEQKIAGGGAEQRAEMATEAAAKIAQSNAADQVAAQAAQAAQARAFADAAAMAAVKRAEAERAKLAADAETAAKQQQAAQSDPAAEARRLLGEAEQLRAQAETERARLEQLGDDYAHRLKRERDRDRVTMLRRMGAIAGVSDVQLLMIAPDVDPETPGGRAEMDQWRDVNSGLFHSATAPPTPNVEALLGTLKSKRSQNGHYGPEYFAQIMARNMERMK